MLPLPLASDVIAWGCGFLVDSGHENGPPEITPEGRLQPSDLDLNGQWARTVSNRRHPACKAGALPLSYAPEASRQPTLLGALSRKPGSGPVRDGRVRGLSPPAMRECAGSRDGSRLRTVQGRRAETSGRAERRPSLRQPSQGEFVMARSVVARTVTAAGVVTLLVTGAAACTSAGDDKDPEHRSFALRGRTLTIDSDDSALEIVAADDKPAGKIEVTRWFQGKVAFGKDPEVTWSMRDDRLTLRMKCTGVVADCAARHRIEVPRAIAVKVEERRRQRPGPGLRGRAEHPYRRRIRTRHRHHRPAGAAYRRRVDPRRGLLAEGQHLDRRRFGVPRTRLGTGPGGVPLRRRLRHDDAAPRDVPRDDADRRRRRGRVRTAERRQLARGVRADRRRQSHGPNRELTGPCVRP